MDLKKNLSKQEKWRNNTEYVNSCKTDTFESLVNKDVSSEEIENCIAYWKNVMKKNINCSLISEKKQAYNEKFTPSSIEQTIQKAIDHVHAYYKRFELELSKQITNFQKEELKNYCIVDENMEEITKEIEDLNNWRPLRTDNRNIVNADTSDFIKHKNKNKISQQNKKIQTQPNDIPTAIAHKGDTNLLDVPIRRDESIYKFVNIIDDKIKSGAYSEWRKRQVSRPCECEKLSYDPKLEVNISENIRPDIILDPQELTVFTKNYGAIKKFTYPPEYQLICIHEDGEADFYLKTSCYGNTPLNSQLSSANSNNQQIELSNDSLSNIERPRSMQVSVAVSMIPSEVSVNLTDNSVSTFLDEKSKISIDDYNKTEHSFGSIENLTVTTWKDISNTPLKQDTARLLLEMRDNSSQTLNYVTPDPTVVNDDTDSADSTTSSRIYSSFSKIEEFIPLKNNKPTMINKDNKIYKKFKIKEEQHMNQENKSSSVAILFKQKKNISFHSATYHTSVSRISLP